MIRFILTVIFVVSFLILSSPIMLVLWLIGKKRPDKLPAKSSSGPSVSSDELPELT